MDLEDRAPQRMGRELLRFADAQQPAHQAGVVEVQLRHASRSACAALRGHAGRRKATKPASRMLSHALAVGWETPQSSASDE